MARRTGYRVFEVDGLMVTDTTSPVTGEESGSTPGVPLPVGGGSGVPAGGTAGQTLIKNSSTDGDANWASLSSVENVNTVATAGASQTLPDPSVASIDFLTLTAASCALTLPTPVAGKSFLLVLAQDTTGGRAATWPSSVLWPNAGTPPALSTDGNALDVFTFVAVNSTNWLGAVRSQNASPSPYKSTVLADSPISYWRLGETSGTAAADEKGVNSGTYTGGVTLGTTGLITTETNKAATFDGTNDYVQVKAGRIVSGLPNFTIEAWVKLTSLDVGPVIYSERGSSGADIVNLNLETNGSVQLTYRDTAGVITQYKPTGTLVGVNTRAHVVATKSGSTVRIYINGIEIGTGGTLTASDTFSGVTTTSRIGSDASGAQWSTGIVDEVAVYASALSLSRIAAHYAAGG